MTTSTDQDAHLPVQKDPGSRRISIQARRHGDMRRSVLAQHPEVAAWGGPNWRYATAIPMLMAIQWGMAAIVAQTNVLICFVAAISIGQLVLHSAAALLHESAHRLIFRKYWPKLALDLGLEAILTSYAKQLTYQHEHISSHHPYLGDYERDYEHEDVCRYLARRAHGLDHPRRQRMLQIFELSVHLLPLGFLLADWIFPRLYRRIAGRGTKDEMRSIPSTKPRSIERILFIVVSIAANAGLFVAFGGLALLYHVWSLSIFLSKWGYTNLGQSLSEHPGDDVINPTRSYYGLSNLIFFNSGYHTEHHTFPNIAGSRLRALRLIAPDIFRFASEKSYVRLWWEHIRDDFTPSRRNEMLLRDNSDRCR